MSLLDFFRKSPRGRPALSLDEVRHEQARLDIRENQCIARIEKLEREKDEIFAKGAKLKSGFRRKQLARMFNQKQGQIVQLEREHNRLSKEAMTLSVLRRALERQKDLREGVLGLLNRVREEELQALLENDKIGYDLYMEKLNNLLGVAEPPLTDVMQEVGKEGMELIDIWQKMDEGEIESAEAGMKLAEKAVKDKALPARERAGEEPAAT